MRRRTSPMQLGVRVERETGWTGMIRGGTGLVCVVGVVASCGVAGPWLHSTPWYQREVSLALRDNVTGQVVYRKPNAQEEGTWSDTPNLLPALFRAALTDFPASAGHPAAQGRCGAALMRWAGSGRQEAFDRQVALARVVVEAQHPAACRQFG